MANFTKQIAVAADDGFEQNAASWLGANDAQFRVGRGGTGVTWKGGVRFATVNVPNGANITSAFITVEVAQKSSTGPLDGKIWGDDVDDAAAWGASSRPSQITKTTASAAWPATWPTAGNTTAISVTSVVQEIVDRAGWASGNDMRFIFEHTAATGNFQNVYLDAKGTYGTPNPATLKIVYTAGGATNWPFGGLAGRGGLAGPGGLAGEGGGLAG